MEREEPVLVADDDPDVLEVVATAVERLGLRVVRAASGEELIECIADEGPLALIITDVSMPWMSGLQAMHCVRTAGLSTPVVVMTALRDETIPEQARSLGKNTVLLHKPFELKELERVVMELLDLRLAS